ncbi:MULTISPECIES: hypothetical protein [unclassified Mesorhizobium]|uniref:hypothetical protein n=1 Tax=unclassified Mesorhizobium TaxID=325217 RepID=UPI0011269B63|nr:MULTISPECIES: hypothetical protein [unclassified Mesorhizobium]TPL42670.1 hypothetical protein FJ961_08240 [Mesorhizobium sp. B2-4-5]TPL66671.1 hypothetical protein FJ949_09910 [Mesorhizobium sp. B2-4-1]
MNDNLKPTIDELLSLKAKIEPLEARYEQLKELIRPAGADTYDIPGKGKVIVSAAVERRVKGSEIVIDPVKLETADRKLKAKLFELGILKTETTYTRASKAKVEVQLAEEVKKAA